MVHGNGDRPGKKRKGAGQRLNDRQRLEIIALLEQEKPPSMRSIARDFGVTEKSIRNIKATKQEVRSRAEGVDIATQESTFRASNPMFPALEKKLLKWIEAGRRVSLSLPPGAICQKAKQIATSMEIDKFNASWGWLSRFRHRYGLDSSILAKGGTEACRQDASATLSTEELVMLMHQYEAQDIFTMDETGLFYRLVPRYTTLLPNEDHRTMRGKKKMKDRITLMVCCNADGSERLPVSMIGKMKSPACISGKTWPIPYYQQRNAWVDDATFTRWFDEVFEPYIQSRPSNKALLILSHAPGHTTPFERRNIRVVLMPNKDDASNNPLRKEVVPTLKAKYKSLLIRDMVAFHKLTTQEKDDLAAQGAKLKRGAPGVAFGHAAQLLDAAKYANVAWKSLSAEQIKSSFSKTFGIESFEGVVESNSEVFSLIEEMVHLLKEFAPLANTNDNDLRREVDKFLADDNDSSEAFKDAILEEVEEALNAPITDGTWPLERTGKEDVKVEDKARGKAKKSNVADEPEQAGLEGTHMLDDAAKAFRDDLEDTSIQHNLLEASNSRSFEDLQKAEDSQNNLQECDPSAGFTNDNEDDPANRQAMPRLLESVEQLEVEIDRLKSSNYISSQQVEEALQAQSVLRRILLGSQSTVV